MNQKFQICGLNFINMLLLHMTNNSDDIDIQSMKERLLNKAMDKEKEVEARKKRWEEEETARKKKCRNWICKNQKTN